MKKLLIGLFITHSVSSFALNIEVFCSNYEDVTEENAIKNLNKVLENHEYSDIKFVSEVKILEKVRTELLSVDGYDDLTFPWRTTYRKACITVVKN